MKREKPVSGEFYQHFKGKLYQVKMLALDSGTQEEMVVYQAMYAPYTCWIRPLQEFMSPVDREKYPQATQSFRFEKVTFTGTPTVEKSVSPESDGIAATVVPVQVSDKELVEALKTGQAERYLHGRATEEDIARRGLLQILDAPTFREKRQIFIGMRQYMDKHMLNNIAVALDIVLEEGDTETQYESIMRCLEAFERYEGGRLR